MTFQRLKKQFFNKGLWNLNWVEREGIQSTKQIFIFRLIRINLQ